MPKQSKRNRDQPSEKYCNGCNRTLPTEKFAKDKRSRDGLQSRCKECGARYYQQNKDRILKRRARHYRRNKDRILKQQARYYRRNKDRILKQQAKFRKQNKDKLRQRWAEYYQRNKDKYLKRNRKRRAKKNASVPYRWRKDPKHDKNLCYWCGVDLTTGKVTRHIEHIMPLSLGGPDDLRNTTSACQRCNLKKGGKHPLVWIASLF